MSRMRCAACGEDLRGRRSLLFDGKPVCADPCGALAKIKRRFVWGTQGALEVTGPELLRLFIAELTAARTTGPSSK